MQQQLRDETKCEQLMTKLDKEIDWLWMLITMIISIPCEGFWEIIDT